MYWREEHMTAGGVLLMVLLILAALGVLVLLAYLFLREAPARRPRPLHPGHDARNVLDDRLARGDIDVEDYQARRSLLTDDQPISDNYRR